VCSVLVRTIAPATRTPTPIKVKYADDALSRSSGQRKRPVWLGAGNAVAGTDTVPGGAEVGTVLVIVSVTGPRHSSPRPRS
jgi:hypothetical protein